MPFKLIMISQFKHKKLLILTIYFFIASHISASGNSVNNTIDYQWKLSDNLDKLALHFGTTSIAIRRLNNIYNEKDIKPGAKIKIPVKKQLANRKITYIPAKKFYSKANNDFISDVDFKNNIIWPTTGTITSGFGIRHGRLHQGIDIGAPKGTIIRAVADGYVTESRSDKAYGNVIIVKHNNRFSTLYAHASRLLIREGQFVRAGQAIAQIGSTGRSTGNHLHFEIRVGGEPENPLNYLQNNSPRYVSK